MPFSLQTPTIFDLQKSIGDCCEQITDNQLKII
ncbi:hypothetical protein QO005_001059 [Rhizobium paknamense]|uniref:Uncharacterized protein n=1 Tax=Rhizobium paknamense TaxID=1206817 RepID=A0ABU0IAK3_9HYPH|nr:hypothetical protein [Rhizobium paknamense]